MRTNFKVSFYLRSNYENKEGKSPVMLRVFLNGEMANFGSTKIFVDKTVWNNATSRLKGRTAEALSANAALDSISATSITNLRTTPPCHWRKSDLILWEKTESIQLSSLYSTDSTKTSGNASDTPSARTAYKSTAF